MTLPPCPMVWVVDEASIERELQGLFGTPEVEVTATGMDFHVEPDPNDLEDPDDA